MFLRSIPNSVPHVRKYPSGKKSRSISYVRHTHTLMSNLRLLMSSGRSMYFWIIKVLNFIELNAF